jgi:hypothetical protein
MPTPKAEDVSPRSSNTTTNFAMHHLVSLNPFFKERFYSSLFGMFCNLYTLKTLK